MATKPKSKPAKSTSAATTTPKPKYTIKGGEVISKPATSPAKGKSPDWYVEKRAAAKAAAASKAPVTPKATPAAPKASPTPPKPTYKLSGQGATKAPYSPSYKGPTRSAAPAKSLANKMGAAFKGKGKAGLIGGMLAAGAAAGYSAYNRGAGTSKKKVVAEESSSKDAAPVSILKGVNRRDEIGKPLTPMVLKSSTASTPKPTASNNPKTVGGPKKTVGGSKSSPNKITKPISFKRDKPITLSGKTERFKSPVRKTAEGVVKNVSLPSLSSKSSAAASPTSQRATLKDLRKEKRSERKITRMARRENRIVNKTAKLKAKR